MGTQNVVNVESIIHYRESTFRKPLELAMESLVKIYMVKAEVACLVCQQITVVEATLFIETQTMQAIRIEAPRSNKSRRRTNPNTIEVNPKIAALSPSENLLGIELLNPFISPSDKLANSPVIHKQITTEQRFNPFDTYDYQDKQRPENHRRMMSTPLPSSPNVSKSFPDTKVAIKEDNEADRGSDDDNEDGFFAENKDKDVIENSKQNAGIINEDKKKALGMQNNSKSKRKTQRTMSHYQKEVNILTRNEWIQEIDALKMMKSGTSFLKYGKWGAPHFRPFRLSQDNTRIVWSSKNKVCQLNL